MLTNQEINKFKKTILSSSTMAVHPSIMALHRLVLRHSETGISGPRHSCVCVDVRQQRHGPQSQIHNTDLTFCILFLKLMYDLIKI